MGTDFTKEYKKRSHRNFISGNPLFPTIEIVPNGTYAQKH